MKILNLMLLSQNEYSKTFILCAERFGHKIYFENYQNFDFAVCFENIRYCKNNLDDSLKIFIEVISNQVNFILSSQEQHYLLYSITHNNHDELVENFEDFIIFLSRTIMNKDFFNNLSVYNIQPKNLQTNDINYKNLGIIEIFNKVVSLYPNNIAIEFNKVSHTYRDFNDDINDFSKKIAIKLNNNGVDDSIVGVILDRSYHAILAIFSILKTGAAFLPIDINISSSRLRYLIEDAKPNLIITNNDVINKFKYESYLNKISIINMDTDEIVPSQQINFEHRRKNSSLAYVIYTSGTTGKPKGVMVEDKNLLHSVVNLIGYLDVSENEKVLQFNKLFFDPSIIEIFTTILSGGCLFIYNQYDKLDGIDLLQFIKENHIANAFLPPAVLSALPYTEINSLKKIILGGESISNNVLKIWSQAYQIINAYGPTEATVYATLHTYIEKDLPNNIGKPLDGTDIYVLNDEKFPVNADEVGELYIGGNGVTRGYLNYPELTSSVFIENPSWLSKENSQIKTVYKTGDFVKLLHDGSLEFIGRRDSQIKLRGYRIEITEIEKVLQNFDGIDKCAVVVTSKIPNKLIAYYVSHNSIDILQLDNYLSDILPEYMIPDLLSKIDALPLTANHKINKKKLEDLFYNNFENNSGEKPQGKIEEQISLIWSRLLNIDPASICKDNNFFALGGHSILVMHLINEINNTFDYRLLPKNIYDNPELHQLSELVEFNLNKEQAIDVSLFDYNNYESDLKPILPVQKSFWLIHQVSSESAKKAFTTPVFYKLDKNINIEILSKSIKELVNWHSGLCNNFIESNTQIYQIKSTNLIEFRIIEGDANGLSSWMDNEANFIFDLANDQLFRPCLYKANDSFDMMLSLTHHHIIADGYSIDILINDLFTIYNNIFCSNTNPVLHNLKFTPEKFSLWYENFINSDTHALKSILYWKNNLPQAISCTLNSDFPRKNNLTYDGNTINFTIPSHILTSIENFSKTNSFTEFSVFLGAFYILLSKYTNEKVINVGVPFANRHYNGVENMVGCLMNTLPLEITVNMSDSINSFLTNVSDKLKQVHDNSDLYYTDIINLLKTKPPASFAPLYQIIFVSELFKFSKEKKQTEKFAKRVNYLTKSSKLDLSCYLIEINSQISLNIEYNTNLFKEETIVNFFKAYLNILEQISSSSIHKISNTKLLNKDQEELILNACSGQKFMLQQKNILDLFYESLVNFENNIVVSDEYEQLTYIDLDSKSNLLVYNIKKSYKEIYFEDLSPGNPILLNMTRSCHIITAIIAIYKLGCFYVPVDIETPAERVSYIKKDTLSKIMLTNHSNMDNNFDKDIILINIDNVLKDYNSLLHNKQKFPIYKNSWSDLAYISYTSGSTGKPKGVMISHNNLINLFYNNRKCYEISANSNIGQYCSFAFDTFAADWILAIGCAANLIIIPDRYRKDPTKLADYIDQTEINYLDIPTALFYLVESKSWHKLHSLKVLKIGGEKLKLEYYPSILGKVYNVYGPTESTVECSSYLIEESKYEFGEFIHDIAIGKPMANFQFYVLDKYFNILPSMVKGELYISGPGLSIGYYRNHELTRERFIQNPYLHRNNFIDSQHDKIYKTGDIVKLNANNDIEYLERTDFQIKIRGLRVELSEIEHMICQFENIFQAVVLPSKNLEQDYLLAYFTSHKLIDHTLLISFLEDNLPDYMIPRKFKQIEYIPLNVNGKVDRDLLNEVNIDIEVINHNISAPENRKELIVLDIFKNILDTRNMGCEDNFFKLGGTSIHAVKVTQELNKIFSSKTIVSMVYNYPTVRSIVEHMDMDFTVIVKLNPNIVNLKKLFLFHSARGSAEVYFNMASLFTDFEIIGIESYNLYNDTIIHSFKDMVTLYVDNILKEFPNLPIYHLAGWSFGGMIAYEAAQQLTNKHNKNCDVMLYDTFNSNMFVEFKKIETDQRYYKYDNYKVQNKYMAKSKIAGDVADEMLLKYVPELANFPVTLFKAIEFSKISDIELRNFFESWSLNGWDNLNLQISTININIDHENIFEKIFVDEIFDLTVNILSRSHELWNI